MKSYIYLVLALIAFGNIIYVGYFISKKNTLSKQVVTVIAAPDNVIANTNLEVKPTIVAVDQVDSSSVSQSETDVKVEDYSSLGLNNSAYVDATEGFSIHVPKDCILTGKTFTNGLVEICRIAKGTNHASAITAAKVSTTLDQDTILSSSTGNLHLKANDEITRDYIVTIQGKKIRAIETSAKVTMSNGKIVELRIYNYFFIKKYDSYSEQYVFSTVTPSPFFDTYKDVLEASLSTIVFQ